MLRTEFVPLSEVDFRSMVADGSAVPVQRGNSLYVAKWTDGRGTDIDRFLTTLREKGSTLEVRRFEKDVNIRIVPRA
ncbi:MAG: hypothetical protein L3K19_05720 [Thermoplasmata archaeon]|nr:hypothetical protein [Thermoplasmata archaeon]